MTDWADDIANRIALNFEGPEAVAAALRAERKRCHALAESEREKWPPGYMREGCENIADDIEESQKWADSFTDQKARDFYIARYEARIRVEEQAECIIAINAKWNTMLKRHPWEFYRTQAIQAIRSRAPAQEKPIPPPNDHQSDFAADERVVWLAAFGSYGGTNAHLPEVAAWEADQQVIRFRAIGGLPRGLGVDWTARLNGSVATRDVPAPETPADPYASRLDSCPDCGEQVSAVRHDRCGDTRSGPALIRTVPPNPTTCTRPNVFGPCSRDGDCPEHGKNRPGQGQTEPFGNSVAGNVTGHHDIVMLTHAPGCLLFCGTAGCQCTCGAAEKERARLVFGLGKSSLWTTPADPSMPLPEAELTPNEAKCAELREGAVAAWGAKPPPRTAERKEAPESCNCRIVHGPYAPHSTACHFASQRALDKADAREAVIELAGNAVRAFDDYWKYDGEPAVHNALMRDMVRLKEALEALQQ